MKLFGTRTSPFVRRVRVVAHMVGAHVELIDTNTEAGQNELRSLTPIWKIPVLEADERALFDSRVINDYLIRRYGNRNIRTESGEGRWREMNLITVIDGALDSAINAFYMKKEQPDIAQHPYLVKQEARVESAMNFIEKQLDGAYLTDVPRIGQAEIALVSALDWMMFRKTYPVERHTMLKSFLRHHSELPIFKSTLPAL